MSASRATSRYNRQNWEDSDFPILCQTCLGNNPYLRMMKDKFGAECKVCQRPFTTFKWCPGKKMRFKKTEICQICAKLKNVCQTCLLDLEYNLPTQVRDSLLSVPDEIPKSDVNKQFYRQNKEIELAKKEGLATNSPLVGNIMHQNHDMLVRLSRTHPYYERNRPHICSFWVKGECKRGEECPYRHEMPTDPNDPLSSQNIRDRYYGINDPVAEKIMQRAAHMPKVEPPQDRSITTLYVGGVDGGITEKDLKDHFYQYGEIKEIHIVTTHLCAFVTFATRASAELAVEGCHSRLSICGKSLKVTWGKSQGTAPTGVPGEKGGAKIVPVPGLPEALPIPSFTLATDYPLPPSLSKSTQSSSSAIHYPSQDPQRMGSKFENSSK